MTAHAVLITHQANPGQRGDAQRAWDELLRPAIDANPDHLTYVYTLPEDEPDVIRAFQLYRTSDAAGAFLQTPEYLAYAEAVEQFLEGPPVVATGAAHWAKI